MSKILKLIFVVALCVAMFLTIGLVGCKTTTAAETTAAETTAAETTAAAATAAETTAAATTAAEKITITMSGASAGINQQVFTDFWTYFINKFEKENPNITVVYKIDGYNAWLDKVKLLGASNQLYDLTKSWGPGWVGPYIKNGSIQDWGPLLNADPAFKECIKPIALAQQKGDEMEYACLPVIGNLNLLGMWANKTVLDKYNLEIPKTFDRLLEEVKILKENKIVPIAYGAKDVWSTWVFNIFLRRYAGKDGWEKFDAIMKGNEKFDNPDFLKGLNHLKELADAGAFPSNATTIGYQEAIQLFKSGEAAFLECGSFAARDIGETDENMIFMAFPAISDALDTTNSLETSYAEGWMLSSNVKGNKLDAVYKLMKFMACQEAAQMFADNVKIIPALNFKIDESKLVPTLKSVIKANEQGNGLPGQLETIMPGSFTVTYNENMSNVATGMKTPKEALDAMDAWYALEYGK